MEVALLVPAAGDVVGEDATLAAAQVVPREEGHDDQALHGARQVLAHHLGQLVRLALEAQRHALDLLVVLELELEEANHVEREARRACDRHP